MNIKWYCTWETIIQMPCIKPVFMHRFDVWDVQPNNFDEIVRTLNDNLLSHGLSNQTGKVLLRGKFARKSVVLYVLVIYDKEINVLFQGLFFISSRGKIVQRFVTISKVSVTPKYRTNQQWSVCWCYSDP